jgi:purine-nucleoside phosphorylase
MATPHLRAEPGDYAPTVLMPGDPLRAKYIAETFLDDARQVNDVRNMLGFTGTFAGNPVSVQSHGMGIPSISIYATELITAFGCDRLIRVGSCGALADDLNLKDLVVAMGAGTDSNVNRSRIGGREHAAIANWPLLRSMVNSAEAKGLKVPVGAVFSSDSFYDPDPTTNELLKRYGYLAVEMEIAGLYGLAAQHNIAAVAICTVSDHIARGEALSSEDRQLGFDQMIEVALDAAF